MASVSALATLSVLASCNHVAAAASWADHVSVDALLALGLLHLLEGHGRLGLWVEILKVERVLHVVYSVGARHDVGESVTWHHQVMRLVDELSMLLHTDAVHIRAGTGTRALKRILLLEVVCSAARLLRARLAMRGWLDLHLEVGLGLRMTARRQVMVLQFVRSNLLRAAFQTAVALFTISAFTLVVIHYEDSLVARDLLGRVVARSRLRLHELLTAPRPAIALHLRLGRDGHVCGHVAISGGLAHRVLRNNQQIAIWISSARLSSGLVRCQSLILAIAQLADDLVLAQPLLLLLLAALKPDVATTGRAGLGVDEEVGVLLDQG